MAPSVVCLRSFCTQRGAPGLTRISGGRSAATNPAAAGRTGSASRDSSRGLGSRAGPRRCVPGAHLGTGRESSAPVGGCPMKSPFAWIAVLLVVAGAAGLYYWRSMGTAEPPPAPPVAAAPAAAPPPEPPRILHPLPEPPADAPALPALADSDRAVNDAVAGLFGRDAFARYLLPGRPRAQVRRDGRQPAAQDRGRPAHAGEARARGLRGEGRRRRFHGRAGQRAALPSRTSSRWRPSTRSASSPTYVRLYPLFQSAYRELGYPDGYFNDRLVFAIDDLLAAPDADGARAHPAEGGLRVRGCRPRAAFGRTEDHDAHGQRQRRARQGQAPRDPARTDRPAAGLLALRIRRRRRGPGLL